MKLGCFTMDTRDADAHADFYQKLLGWEVRFSNTDADIKYVGLFDKSTGVALLFQEDADYEPPVIWATERGQQQVQAHVDFHTDDLERDAAHAVACGAKPVDMQYSDKWRVFIDPMGHPFCIEQLH